MANGQQKVYHVVMNTTTIIIPVKDKSERLRQKDVLLLPFTLEYCQGRQNVYTYGWLSE